ncbi:unnamed protein product [Effrenium voratum]|nr:unnamed protein product [Effrenium voratum]
MAVAGADVLDDLFIWAVTTPSDPLKDPQMPSSAELDAMFQANLMTLTSACAQSREDKLKLARRCRSISRKGCSLPREEDLHSATWAQLPPYQVIWKCWPGGCLPWHCGICRCCCGSPDAG